MNNIEYQITIPHSPNIADLSNNISAINIDNNIQCQKIISYNEYILNSLNNYFGSINSVESTSQMNKILPILEGKSKLSIRVIDWFVTNFSKKKKYSLSFVKR